MLVGLLGQSLNQPEAARAQAAAGLPDPALAPLLRKTARDPAVQRREVMALRAYLRQRPPDAAARFLALTRLFHTFERLQLDDSAQTLLSPLLTAAGRARRRLPLETAMAADAVGEQWFGLSKLDSARRCFELGAEWLSAAPLDFRGRKFVRLTDANLTDEGTHVPGSALGHLYGNLGLTNVTTNPPAAAAALNRALVAYQRADDNGGQAWMLSMLCGIYTQQRQPAQALAYVDQSLEVARRDSNPRAFNEAVLMFALIRRTLNREDLPALKRLLAEGQRRLAPQLATRPADHDLLNATVDLQQVAAEYLTDPATGRETADALARLLPRLRRATPPGLLQEMNYFTGRLSEGVARARGMAPTARAALLRHTAMYLDSISSPEKRQGRIFFLADHARRMACPNVTIELMLPLDQQERQAPFLGFIQRQTLYEQLRHSYASLGQWREAYKAMQREFVTRDSIQARRFQRSLAAADAQYRTRESERRAERLAAQNRLQALRAEQQQARTRWLLGGLLGLAAALVAFGVLIVRLRRSRQALAAATHTKDRLYAIIGHDLRGPLVAFQALAPLLDTYRRLGDYEALGEVTSEVRQASQRLTELLDNLLHWAAGQSGELAYRPERLPAADLLAEVAALYDYAARTARVTLHPAAAADLMLRADRNMTRTILRNLVHNALRVSAPGTELHLTAAPAEAGRVVLTVRDQGPGLTAEQVQAILTKGTAPAGAAGTPRGTGLGLPLVRQLTQRQGGTFGLESTPGVGTAVHVTLPAA